MTVEVGRLAAEFRGAGDVVTDPEILESYRRDGTAVRTPLWFVDLNGEMAFYTMAASGKVKRLRRNPRVRVAPCTGRARVAELIVEAKASSRRKLLAARVAEIR